MSKPFLPLVFLFLGCLLSGCRDDGDCTPSPGRRLDVTVLSAIPHTDAQRISYTVSDGTTLDVTFRGGFEPAVEGTGCTERFLMDFRGSNDFHSLKGNIDVYPEASEMADIYINFDVNTARDNTLKIELLETGNITAGRNATARVLSETTRNGTTYANVLEQTYPSTSGGAVSRVYYSTALGLLGVELVDGTTLWQR